MTLFTSTRYHALLARNGLHTFAGFWELPQDWVEEPNERRNGWSGVSRHTLLDEELGHLSIFVKRQENHNYRSLRHPLRGRPTFFRDFLNIRRMAQIGIPTVEPVFYGERLVGNKVQAVLTTIGLEGYTELTSLFQDPALAPPVRRAVLHNLTDAMLLMHRHRFEHRSLGGNHVMVRLEDGGCDLRILDLEKMRRSFRSIDAAVMDLEKFIRHTPTLTPDESTELLQHYTRHFSPFRRRRLVQRIEKRLSAKCSRKGQATPLIHLTD